MNLHLRRENHLIGSISLIGLILSSFVFFLNSAFGTDLTTQEVLKQLPSYVTIDPSIANQYAKNPNHEQIAPPIPLSKLKWHLDTRERFESTPLLAPEQIQKLFLFDFKSFSKDSNGDFLQAKLEVYRKLKYDRSKKTFILPFHNLAEWGDLIHPPFFSVPLEAEKTHQSDPPSLRWNIDFQKKIDSLSSSELTSNNQITFVNNGEVFTSLLERVRESKKNIIGSTLFLTCDSSTQKLVDALTERSRQGVFILFFVDYWLQWLQNGSCISELEKGGIHIIRIPGFLRDFHSYHMKGWAIDSQLALIQGMNLADAEIQSDGMNHAYRDMGAWVKGAAASDIARVFLNHIKNYSVELDPTTAKRLHSLETELTETEVSEKQHHFRGTAEYGNWLEKRTPGLCRVVQQDRKTVPSQVAQTLHEFLLTAQSSVWAPSVRRIFTDRNSNQWHNTLLNDFEILGRRGVTVDFLINGEFTPFSTYNYPSSGMRFEDKANLLVWFIRKKYEREAEKAIDQGSELFETWNREIPKLRVWSYFNYAHLKSLLIDQDTWTSGSFNILYNRSNSDTEIELICQDLQSASVLAEIAKKDLYNSTPFPLHSQFK